MIPLSDYPDALVKYKDNPFIDSSSLSQLFQSSYADVYPLSQLSRVTWGSYYDSYKIHLPSIEVLLLFLSPILIVITWLCLASIYFKGQLIRTRLRKVSQLTFLLPSTAYYLLSVHPEVYASAIGLGYFLVFVSATKESLSQRLRLFVFAIFSILSLMGVDLLVMPDSQYYLVSIFIMISILYLFRIDLTRWVFPVKLFGCLFSSKVNIALALSIVLGSVYAFQNSIRVLMSSTDNLASAAALAYVNNNYIVEKYPALLRPFLSFSTAIFATSSGFTIFFAGKLVLFLIFASSMSRQLQLNNRKHDAQLCLLLVLFIVIISFILPGYTNYKYFFALTPVFCGLLTENRSIRVAMLFLWLEILARLFFSSL